MRHAVRSSSTSCVPRLVDALRLAALLLPLLTLALNGCEAIGAIGAKTVSTVIAPSYVGLKGQSIGVMVWADDGYRWDDNALVLDVMQGVANKLKGAQARGAEELKGATFPRAAGPDAIYAFQANHPEAAAEPITDVAPRLGVTRLIYIEINDFNLHSGAVVELTRGHLSGTVKVVEVTGRTARIVNPDTVEVTWPKQSPDEGLPGIERRDAYIGTVDAFCTAVVEKFVTHPAQ